MWNGRFLHPLNPITGNLLSPKLIACNINLQTLSLPKSTQVKSLKGFGNYQQNGDIIEFIVCQKRFILLLHNMMTPVEISITFKEPKVKTNQINRRNCVNFHLIGQLTKQTFIL